MYPASFIAFLFAQKGILEQQPVTQMKLQKMVYFAHGYHLAKYNSPLVEEEFEAWQYGPVVPAIYQEFKSYGSSPIMDVTRLFSYFANRYALDEKAKDAIEYTWGATKDVNAVRLSAWTHIDGSPWQKVYNPSEWQKKIYNDSIKEYFINFLSA